MKCLEDRALPDEVCENQEKRGRPQDGSFGQEGLFLIFLSYLTISFNKHNLIDVFN